MRRFEIETPEYVIVNDSGLRYSLLTYYIIASSQIAQLKELGFRIEGVYGEHGCPAV
jgi:hypothetical protein